VKIKRVVQGKIAVLQVTETYSIQDLAILKAGVNQMTSSGGDKLMIVDLTAAKPATPSLAAEITALQALAAENEAALLIASPNHAELGGATVEDARNRLISSEFRSSLEETFLNARANKLDRRKNELETKTKDSSSKEQELRKLQTANSELRKTHRMLLRQVKSLLDEAFLLLDLAPAGKITAATSEDTGKAHSTIRSILDQLGVAKP
jgi:hypothetical protein